jgi:hypothetical protein
MEAGGNSRSNPKSGGIENTNIIHASRETSDHGSLARKGQPEESKASGDKIKTIWTTLATGKSDSRHVRFCVLDVQIDYGGRGAHRVSIINGDGETTDLKSKRFLWMFTAYTCECCGSREREVICSLDDFDSARDNFHAKYPSLEAVEAEGDSRQICRIELMFQDGDTLSVGLQCAMSTFQTVCSGLAAIGQMVKCESNSWRRRRSPATGSSLNQISHSNAGKVPHYAGGDSATVPDKQQKKRTRAQMAMEAGGTSGDAAEDGTGDSGSPDRQGHSEETAESDVPLKTIWTTFASGKSGSRRVRCCLLDVHVDESRHGGHRASLIIDGETTELDSTNFRWMFTACTCDCCGLRERELLCPIDGFDGAQDNFHTKYPSLKAVEAGSDSRQTGRIEIAFFDGNTLSVGLECAPPDLRKFQTLCSTLSNIGRLVKCKSNMCKSVRRRNAVTDDQTAESIKANGEAAKGEADRHMMELLATVDCESTAHVKGKKKNKKKANKTEREADPSNNNNVTENDVCLDHAEVTECDPAQ